MCLSHRSVDTHTHTQARYIAHTTTLNSIDGVRSYEGVILRCRQFGKSFTQSRNAVKSVQVFFENNRKLQVLCARPIGYMRETGNAL